MKRKMTPAARAELVDAIRARYVAASAKDKGRILEEFIAATGYHEKSAIRVLNMTPAAKQRQTRHPAIPVSFPPGEATLAGEFFSRGVDYIGTAWEVSNAPALLFAQQLIEEFAPACNAKHVPKGKQPIEVSWESLGDRLCAELRTIEHEASGS